MIMGFLRAVHIRVPFFFGLFLLIFGGAPFAHAVSTGLSIQPLKATHTLNPGASVSGVVEITNAGDNAVNVEVSVEDFVPLEGTYNIQIVERAPGVSTVRDWVFLDAPSSFVLERGALRRVPYTIRAPENAEPGGHFGVALFKASELPENGGQQLKVGTRVGMLILVTIPGNRLEQGSVLDFSAPRFIEWGPIRFVVKFKNTGTVHFEPKGVIRITNMFGREIGTIPVGGHAVLPTGVKDIPIEADVGGTLLGRYAATLTLNDGSGNEIAARRTAFWVFPIWYVVAFFGTIAVLYLLIRFFRKYVRITISRNTNE